MRQSLLDFGLGLGRTQVITVPAVNLVVNGDFSGGSTGWTAAAGDITFGSGVASFNASGTYRSLRSIANAGVTNGQTVRMSFEVVTVTTSGGLRMRIAATDFFDATSITVPGVYTADVTITGGDSLVRFDTISGNAFAGTIDNVSIQVI